MFVDLVNFEFLFAPELLSADVACEYLKVNLAIVVVEEIGPGKGLKVRNSR